jgi:hypothetical protein
MHLSGAGRGLRARVERRRNALNMISFFITDRCYSIAFNAGIFSFTGTGKSPLNMFRPRILTMNGPLAAAVHGLAVLSLQNFLFKNSGLSFSFSA